MYVERIAGPDSEFIGIEPDFDNPQDRFDCPIHKCDCEDHQWGNCPVAVEGDPPEVKSCGYFAEELHLRMKDMNDGNYVSMIFPGNDKHPGNGDGRVYVQHYENHKPVGEIEVMFSSEPFEGFPEDDDV